MTRRTKNSGKWDEIVEELLNVDPIKTTWDEIVEELLNVDPIKTTDEEGNEIKIPKITDYSLLENPNLQVPNKMDLFKGLDITAKDKLFIKICDNNSYKRTVLFVNGEDRAIGFFNLETFAVDGVKKHYLTTEAENIDFSNHKSTKYYFVFATGAGTSFKLFKVPIEVEYHDTETTSTHLCVDFGTSNTTIGCYLDDHYVDDISNLAIINGNVVLNTENVTTFMDKELLDSKTGVESYVMKRLVPTVVYFNDFSDQDYI